MAEDKTVPRFVPAALVELYELACKANELVRDSFPDVEQAQVLITLPHAKLTEIARDNPSLAQGDEPYLKFAIGNVQVVLTSEEALLLGADSHTKE